ncbi:hypothetical protein [Saccharothrix carnea]|uniref:hypothetical protein n=1 Tax=Saccharothrix carnea TaxID=1280637 RepID=UPI000D0CE2D2|nr:hypothetical protein [Saccharothrix carnea]
MPHGFTFGPTLDPAHRSDVPDALYVSLVAVATLGFRRHRAHLARPAPRRVLFDLVGAVAQVRVDLTRYGVTYYFRDRDDAAALSGKLGFAVSLTRDAASSADPAVRFAGAALGGALDDLAETSVGASCWSVSPRMRCCAPTTNGSTPPGERRSAQALGVTAGRPL